MNWQVPAPLVQAMPELSHSPTATAPISKKKQDSDAASAESALAPTLEHREQSNEEEDHGNRDESLDPHKRLTCW